MTAGLLLASTLDAGSAYFGPVIISMALLAMGLSLVTAPATEAVMSSLPREKAGAGAAVNDTTREASAPGRQRRPGRRLRPEDRRLPRSSTRWARLLARADGVAEAAGRMWASVA